MEIEWWWVLARFIAGYEQPEIIIWNLHDLMEIHSAITAENCKMYESYN
jgi:hypothetical protein